MQWSLDPVGGPWTAAAAACALVALPLVVRPRSDSLTPKQRRALVALRLGTLLLLIIAWLRPALVNVRSEPVAETLVVLVDDSQSMSTPDAAGGATRYEAARRALRAAAPALRVLGEKQSVRVYRFAAATEAAPVATGEVSLPEEPAGDATALGDALADILAAEGDEPLLGVVVLSDGAQRSLPPRDTSPLALTRRLAATGAPVYAAPIGQRAAADRSDLAIEDLVAGDSVYAGTPLEVGVRLHAEGLAGRTARVQLLWESDGGAGGSSDEVVDTVEVALTPGVTDYPITLRHTPTAVGERRLTVRAEPIDGEAVLANNQTGTFVTVREGGVRVLYLVGATRVGGAPTIEQRFVRASLAESPDVVVQRVVIDYRQPRVDLRDRVGPDRVDVLFLENVDAEGLDARTWQAIAERVAQGAGLAMLGGAQSFGPGGHRASAMGEVLPIEMGRAERQALGEPIREDVHLAGPVPLRPAPPLGPRHPVVRIRGGDPTAEWKRLPPLDGANRLDRGALKPTAAVLLESDDARAAPVLIAGQFGLGRVLAFGGDTTWRWVLQGHADAHRRFWRQAVLWLAKKDDSTDQPVFVALSGRRVAPGARLDATVGVRLADEARASSLRYEASVTPPRGQATPLAAPGGRVTSTASFRQTREPGEYTVSVRALDGDRPLGEARARFLVPAIDLELDRPGAEPETLAALAEATASAGGRVLAPEELPELLEELASHEPERRQEVVSRYEPWDTWPFFLLVVSTLSTEWWLRRRWGTP